MTKKDTEETKDQKVIIQQHNRAMQFSQAADKNTSLFKGIMIFLVLIIALAAFLALVCGDAYWAKSFPHKDDRLTATFICLTLVTIAFAIVTVVSGKAYLAMVNKISAETRGMYEAWVVDNTDFRHDIDAKITTFVQYAAKELTGLLTTLAFAGIVISTAMTLFEHYGNGQFCNEFINNGNLCGFATAHTLVIVGINLAVVLLTIVPVFTAAADLIEINFNGSNLPGSDAWKVNTTFADRLALLQMPPKEVKTDGTKNNGGE